MKQIKKDGSNVPSDFIEYVTRKKLRKVDIDAGHHRQSSGRSLFDDIIKKTTKRYSVKNLKIKLLRDQGFICCYCNERVELDNCSIEHIVTIETDKSLLAEYSNLLISCNGGKNDRNANPTEMQMYPLYCDAGRDNAAHLPFGPLDIICECSFSFSYIDGSISGVSKAGQTVISALNLDCLSLRRKRLAAYEIIFDGPNILDDDELELIWDKLWIKDSSDKYTGFFFQILSVIYDII